MFWGGLFTVLGVGGRWLEWSVRKKRGNEGKWPPKESVSTGDMHKGPGNCKMANDRNCKMTNTLLRQGGWTR